MTIDFSVIIPVGPGHEDFVDRAISSVEVAHRYHGRAEVEVLTVADPAGAFGASIARNAGLLEAEAPRVIFLDADDLLDERAFVIAQTATTPVLWGAWRRLLRGRSEDRPAWRPFSWDGMVLEEPRLPVGMSGVFETSAARRLLFDERLDYGEGTEFCYAMAAENECAIDTETIVVVDGRTRSAQGPKRQGFQVGGRTAEVRAFWKKRGRVPLTDEERRGRKLPGTEGLRPVRRVLQATRNR